MISPVFFCVYVVGLLKLLSDAKVGCYIGHVFVGAFAYADDIVLLAPTARVMRKLLSLCDEFASRFNVLFNAKKSKCLYIRPKEDNRSNCCLKPMLTNSIALPPILSQCLISVAKLLNLFGSGHISVI